MKKTRNSDEKISTDINHIIMNVWSWNEMLNHMLMTAGLKQGDVVVRVHTL